MARFSETTRSLAIIAAVLFIATNNVALYSSTPLTPIETEASAAAPSDTNAAVVVAADTDAISPTADDAVAVVVADNGPAVPSLNETLDSNCDCEDVEALYHKAIRQLIDTDVIKGKEEFLKEFRVKKICGSDGNLYSTECEFECTRMKHTEASELHKVGRSRCRRPGKGKVHKGKENSRHISKHNHGNLLKSGRMQRPDNEPETLVCICPRNFFPVCASNGVTYGNRCAFECAKENIDAELTIVTLGEKCNPDDKTVLKPTSES